MLVTRTEEQTLLGVLRDAYPGDLARGTVQKIVLFAEVAEISIQIARMVTFSSGGEFANIEGVSCQDRRMKSGGEGICVVPGLCPGRQWLCLRF